MWIISKYLITAAMVVLISELAKRSDKLGSLLAALPLVTILTLVWLYIEGQSHDKIANHAYYTFWYVLPTLPMFLAFPWMLSRWGFWGALGASVLMSMVCFLLVAFFAKHRLIRRNQNRFDEAAVAEAKEIFPGRIPRGLRGRRGSRTSSSSCLLFSRVSRVETGSQGGTALAVLPFALTGKEKQI